MSAHVDSLPALAELGGMAAVLSGKPEAITPGLYPGVPALRYHRWPGASQSRLKVLREHTPLHLRYEMDHPSDPTESQVLGAAIHTVVLEPDDFTTLYKRKPEGDGRSKAVKEAVELLVEMFPQATLLKPAHYDACLAIRDAVAAHPTASGMLERSHIECSAVWVDPETGVLSRGRFDDLGLELGAITDLKSTTDACPARFPKAIYDWGYHIQGAHYLRGAKALGIEADTFGIIAVEKEPPYAVATYELQPAALFDGARELDRLLQIWAKCEESGVWPGYNTDVVKVDLPRWAPREIDERLGEA